MKATLEFQIPEEEQEFMEAVNGGMFKHILWKLDQDLRGKLKHGTLTECESKCYQEVRDEIRTLLQSHNLEI